MPERYKLTSRDAKAGSHTHVIFVSKGKAQLWTSNEATAASGRPSVLACRAWLGTSLPALTARWQGGRTGWTPRKQGPARYDEYPPDDPSLPGHKKGLMSAFYSGVMLWGLSCGDGTARV